MDFCGLSIIFISFSYSIVINCSMTIHGGLTFGPLSPPSRDGICMPKQVWSTFFLFEIFDHMINSLRIRRFGPYSNSSNMQVWSTSNRKSGPNLRIRTDLMPRDHKLFEFAGLVLFSVRSGPNLHIRRV